jgi:molybdopterin synthase sulfur carrier subunit
MPTVKLFASLRRIAGIKEKTVPGGTLRAVLDALTQSHPQLRPVLGAGDRIMVIVTLNGQTLPAGNMLDTRLAEEDQIAIFPPIAGG